MKTNERDGAEASLAPEGPGLAGATGSVIDEAWKKFNPILRGCLDYESFRQGWLFCGAQICGICTTDHESKEAFAARVRAIIDPPQDRINNTPNIQTASAPAVASGDLLGGPVRRFPVAVPKPVHPDVAVCPECGGMLTWQVTTKDGLRDMTLDCEYEDIWDEDESGNCGYVHRGFQSDWQPVIERVKAWILSANTKVTCSSPESGAATKEKL